MKTCTKCGIAKRPDDFSRFAKSKDGRYSTCRACKALLHQQYVSDPANRERLRAHGRARYAVAENRARQAALVAERRKDPAIREQMREAVRRCYRRDMADPVRRKLKSERITLAKRGLTREQRDAMFASQQGRCAVCRTDKPCARGWHIDHCHKTKRVRAILCANCNNALGFLRESVSTAEAMVEYIKRKCAA